MALERMRETHEAIELYETAIVAQLDQKPKTVSIKQEMVAWGEGSDLLIARIGYVRNLCLEAVTRKYGMCYFAFLTDQGEGVARAPNS